jgi:hypothetical protein
MMNGKIIELARQATGRQVVGASDFADWDVIERLAESIVRECAQIGFDAAYPHGGVDVAEAIKKHFGVE